MSEEKLPRHETAFIHTGSLRAPSIIFNATQSTGLYVNESEGISIKINNKPIASFNQKYIEYKTPIIITNETNDMGILFKKPNDNNLWWKGNDQEELCLSQPHITSCEIIELKKIYNDLYVKYSELLINFQAQREQIQEFTKPLSPMEHKKSLFPSILKLEPIIELSELSPIREDIIDLDTDAEFNKQNINNLQTEPIHIDNSKSDIKKEDYSDNISIYSQESHHKKNNLNVKYNSIATLEIGDIVGIDTKNSSKYINELNSLYINKVIGGKWEINKLEIYNYNFILNKKNISLQIKDDVLAIAIQNGEMQIHKYIILYKDYEDEEELINFEEIECKNSTHSIFTENLCEDKLTVKLIHLIADTYLIGIYNSQSSFKNRILIIKVSIEDNKLIEQQTIVNFNKSIETFDILYDVDLDIVLLTVYNDEDFNLTVCLMIADPFHPHKKVIQKYTRSNISDVIITGPNKTLSTLLIVGQVVLIAYANTKTLLWLPSSAEKEFSSGPTTINHNISDCISLYYDMENCVILSAEKTLTDYCFINIMDIYGTKIETQLSKKINTFTTIPLSLNYNKLTKRFILFYTDALTYGSLNSQIFSYNCDNIITHARYSTEELPILTNNDFKSYQVEDNVFVLYCQSNKKNIQCKFFDNYKIQPESFIGIVQNVDHISNEYTLTYKGQIFSYEEKPLPFDFIGKKLYLNHNTLHLSYPYNITTNGIGNTFIGTAVSYHSIILGL
jgi:hypothetical protein